MKFPAVSSTLLVVIGTVTLVLSDSCQDRMDAWCNEPANCLNDLPAGSGPLYALHDTNAHRAIDQWRCYAASTLDVSGQHYENGTAYCTRDTQLAQVYASCVPNLTSVDVFTHGEGGFPCIRIPAVVLTPHSLIAFAECRFTTGDGCIPTATVARPPSNGASRVVCTKQSFDGGLTWSSLVVPFGTDYTQSQPTIVWDAVRSQTVLQFCANGSNFQSTSKDGVSWTRPHNIGGFLGQWKGADTGPGTGIQLQHGPHAGRMLFIAHYGAYQNDVVFYTDDGGATYNLSQTVFPHMDEAQLVELSTGDVMANMRNNHYLPGDCRGVAISHNGGESFGTTTPAPQLISPVCMASILSDPSPSNGTLYFANPASKVSRDNMRIRRSDDNGHSWPHSFLVSPSDAAYACLSALPPSSRALGLLWESTAPHCDGPSCLIKFTLVPKSLIV